MRTTTITRTVTCSIQSPHSAPIPLHTKTKNKQEHPLATYCPLASCLGPARARSVDAVILPPAFCDFQFVPLSPSTVPTRPCPGAWLKSSPFDSDAPSAAAPLPSPSLSEHHSHRNKTPRRQRIADHGVRYLASTNRHRTVAHGIRSSRVASHAFLITTARRRPQAPQRCHLLVTRHTLLRAAFHQCCGAALLHRVGCI